MFRWPWLFLLLTGCATYSQLMINPNGQTMICQAHGSGLLGSGEAKRIQQRCQESLRAAGYIEIERAGVIGIAVSDSFFIMRVVPQSPADSVGLRPGDRIEAIDGQAIHDPHALRTMLLGAPGSTVRLRVLRADQAHEFVAFRKSYPLVWGVQPPPLQPRR